MNNYYFNHYGVLVTVRKEGRRKWSTFIGFEQRPLSGFSPTIEKARERAEKEILSGRFVKPGGKSEPSSRKEEIEYLKGLLGKRNEKYKTN